MHSWWLLLDPIRATEEKGCEGILGGCCRSGLVRSTEGGSCNRELRSLEGFKVFNFVGTAVGVWISYWGEMGARSDD